MASVTALVTLGSVRARYQNDDRHAACHVRAGTLAMIVQRSLSGYLIDAA